MIDRMMRVMPLVMLLGGCAANAVVPAEAKPAEAAAPARVDLASLSLTRLDGTPMPAEELAGKAVLFVNVASKCGYTPQYEGLQKLWETYGPRGLVVVGVPCNQFAGQEPGSAEDIASFCKMSYGVTFPLLAKQDVNGKDRSPLYAALVGSAAGGGANIKWNFEKFLLAPGGEVKARFGSSTRPDSAELVKAIEAALPAGA
jgi:glutathione peroxidase